MSHMSCHLKYRHPKTENLLYHKDQIPNRVVNPDPLYLLLYFSTEYLNSRQNIIILYWKYFADIRSEAWLNLGWEYKNGKLFAEQDEIFAHFFKFF
jgi:hypothetical protein